MTNVLEFKSDNFTLKAFVKGEGRVMLVIGSHMYYARTFSDELAAHFKVIFLDTRGFVAQPAHESDFTIDKLVEDIENFRLYYGINEFVLVGHSIHAFIALEYTKRYPKQVTSLLLIASSPIVGLELHKEADRYFEESVCPQRKAAFANTMKKFIKSGDQSFVARLLSFGPRIWYDEYFDASKLWEGVVVNSIGAGIIWGSMFDGYDTVGALKAIQCPIFLVLGRYDYFNPPHLWEKYRTFASDLTIRIFERSGHTPQLEEAENFKNELIYWLSE